MPTFISKTKTHIVIHLFFKLVSSKVELSFYYKMHRSRSLQKVNYTYKTHGVDYYEERQW